MATTRGSNNNNKNHEWSVLLATYSVMNVLRVGNPRWQHCIALRKSPPEATDSFLIYRRAFIVPLWKTFCFCSQPRRFVNSLFFWFLRTALRRLKLWKRIVMAARRGISGICIFVYVALSGVSQLSYASVPLDNKSRTSRVENQNSAVYKERGKLKAIHS